MYVLVKYPRQRDHSVVSLMLLLFVSCFQKIGNKRANSSSLVRNAEVWKFALQCVFRVLKPRKMNKKGTYSEEEIEAKRLEAAEFIRDGFLELGPSFVKLYVFVFARRGRRFVSSHPCAFFFVAAKSCQPEQMYCQKHTRKRSKH